MLASATASDHLLDSEDAEEGAAEFFAVKRVSKGFLMSKTKRNRDLVLQERELLLKAQGSLPHDRSLA